MHREGLRCPKCGSTRIGIIAGGQFQLKCMECGYVWMPSLVPSGYIEVNGRLIHWTEIEAAKEKLLNELRDVLEGAGGCELIKPILAKYTNTLDAERIIRVVKNALTQAEPNLRLKGQSFVERYSKVVMACVNEYLNSTKVIEPSH
ncbi:hypothetical protein [Caldivirga sp.]|jgi:hypothetical protein|uniref:hypothetical protein n=1 Tax=Caldivirga sp. TaxID=2080243 RepID=UPI003D0E6EC8